MAVSLCPVPKMQFLKDNGQPAAGYYLYTYAAGLPSTPKGTYTDSTATAFNSWPIPLDAAGRASIWLDGYYYMELWTALKAVPGASLVWSQDNVSSADYSGAEYATVAANIATINSVAENMTDIQTVTDIEASVVAVSEISSNVTTVATNAASVVSVANNMAEVLAVYGLITNGADGIILNDLVNGKKYNITIQSGVLTPVEV